MSILSSNSADLKSRSSNFVTKYLVSSGRVYAVETEQSSEDILLKKISEIHGITYKSNNSFIKELNTIAEEEGIKVYGVDCAVFQHRYDVIGWLRALSELPEETKHPLIVLENVTSLLPEFHNVLLHSWKNDTNQFCDDRPGQDGTFTIDNRKYRIFLTWDKSKSDELKAMWHPGDGYTWIGNYEEWKRKWKEVCPQNG